MTPSKAMAPRAGSGRGAGSAGAAMEGRAARISLMRCMAPAAFCSSPITSPICPTELAASTARMMNCKSTPGLMLWRMKVALQAR